MSEKVVDKAKSMMSDAQDMAGTAAGSAKKAARSAKSAASTAASAAMDSGEMMVEEIQTTGGNLVEKIKEIIQEGNARHIRIRNEDGDTIMEMPLTAGVAVGSGAAVAMMAAIGGLASVLSKVNVDVRKPRKRSSSSSSSGSTRSKRS